MVLANKKDPSLEGGNYTKNGGMWTLKHKTVSKKFYELLTKTELNGDNTLELNNLYNDINMCINAMNHHMPSNILLVFKGLHPNLLNIVSLLTLKVVLGYDPTRLKTI